MPDVMLTVAGGRTRARCPRASRSRARTRRPRLLPREPSPASGAAAVRAATRPSLSSAWENFPHTVVEALAVGCPVRDSRGRRAGGRARGERTTRAARRTDGALCSDRAVLGDDELRARLRCGIAVGGGYSRRRPSRRSKPSCSGSSVRKRLLMVGRSRYALPLALARAKFDALSGEIDVHVLASAGRASGMDRRFTLVRPIRPLACSTVSPSTRRCRFGCAGAPHLQARRRARARCARGSALRGRARVARLPTRVIADIHGDPAAPARLYGSLRRKLLAPLADAIARYGLRHATESARSRHTSSRPRCGRRAERRGPPRSWTRAVRRVYTRSASRAAGRHLRRRARALQGRRRACRGVAARCPACARAGLHLVGRGTPHEPRPRARAASADALVRHSRRGRSQALDRRRFSCFRLAPRASVASSWRRSAAAGCYRQPCRRHPRHRRRRRDRILVQPGDTKLSLTRSSACSPIVSSPCGSGGRA